MPSPYVIINPRIISLEGPAIHKAEPWGAAFRTGAFGASPSERIGIRKCRFS
jgi:hypothetical protein